MKPWEYVALTQTFLVCVFGERCVQVVDEFSLLKLSSGESVNSTMNTYCGKVLSYPSFYSEFVRKIGNRYRNVLMYVQTYVEIP